MENAEHTIGGVTYSGPVAKAAAQITDEEWAYYSLIDKLTDLIAEFMDESGVTKADLARQLGTSRAFVSKVLAGDAHNMTIKTLSRIVDNLNARLEFKIVSKDEAFSWMGITRNTSMITKSPLIPAWGRVHTLSACGRLSIQTEHNGKDLVAA